MVDLDLRFYLAIFLRRLPYFVAIVTIVFAITVVVAYLIPRVYRASAKILFETPQISAYLANSPIPSDAIEQLQVVQQKITTRENLLVLAEKFKIYANEETKPSDSDIVQDMQSRVSFEQLQLDARGQGATIFSVSFDAKEPELAAKVVNELVTLTLSKNTRLRTDRAQSAAAFFDNEVARLSAELKRLEGDILKFKEEHKDALPDGLAFRRDRQGTLQERLRSLEHEEAELRSRRNNLVQTFDSTGQLTGQFPSTPEEQQLQELNRTLTEQLAIFTETSPTIVALRTRITSLQHELRSRPTPGPDGRKVGPSQLDLQVSEIDERLNSIANERSAVAAEVAELTKSVDATPANETVLNSLERDHTNLQTQYNSAVARLAEASTGEQIELLSEGPRFSLIEPAIPPERPISPHRRRIAAMGGATGIGLGLAFIVLLEMLNKTIRRPAELVQIFQTQPLATIPYIPIGIEGRSSAMKRGLGVLIVAGATAAVLLAVHYYLMPLGLVIEKLMVGLNLGRTV